jgi:MGT family glycosyltransferase
MAKFLFFNIPATGHINPTLPVIREMVQRGHEVITYLSEGYRNKIEVLGATFRAYGEHIPDDFFERHGLNGSRPASTACLLAQTSLEMMPELLKIIETERPDAILHDSMCPWGWIAAKAAGVRHISSTTLLMLSPVDMVWVVGPLPILRLGATMLGDVQRFGGLAKQIEQRYGVKLPGFADFLNAAGDITISYTSSMVQPHASKLSPSIKFVGPSIEPRSRDRARDDEFPWDALDGRPVLYVSLGTVINQNAAFYRACMEAFQRFNAQIVMSVGKKTDIGALGPIPENFIVRNFVPQLEVLQKAAAFVTHAGMNSVHEGLFYNVPLILVPQQMEQRIVATRIQELHAGVMVKTATPDASQLAAATSRVLNHAAYKAQATKVGKSLRTAGGHCRAVDEIEGMLGEG